MSLHIIERDYNWEKILYPHGESEYYQECVIKAFSVGEWPVSVITNRRKLRPRTLGYSEWVSEYNQPIAVIYV